MCVYNGRLLTFRNINWSYFYSVYFKNTELPYNDINKHL